MREATAPEALPPSPKAQLYVTLVPAASVAVKVEALPSSVGLLENASRPVMASSTITSVLATAWLMGLVAVTTAVYEPAEP